MAKTAQTQQAQEEKILIANDELRALASIESATEQLPMLNALLAQYKSLGFERVIKSEADFWDLANDFDLFIQTERLKDVPETISGMKINRVEFLNKFVEKPEGLAELKEAVLIFPKHRMYFNLFRFDQATGEFALCSEKCAKHKEDHKQYAKGRQLQLLQAAEELHAAGAKLKALGIHPLSILQKDSWNHSDWFGYHDWILKDRKEFAFRIKAEEEV